MSLSSPHWSLGTWKNAWTEWQSFGRSNLPANAGHLDRIESARTGFFGLPFFASSLLSAHRVSAGFINNTGKNLIQASRFAY